MELMKTFCQQTECPILGAGQQLTLKPLATQPSGKHMVSVNIERRTTTFLEARTCMGHSPFPPAVHLDAQTFSKFVY